MKKEKRKYLKTGIVIGIIILTIVLLELRTPQKVTEGQSIIVENNARIKEKQAQFAPAREFADVQGYLNTQPFKLQDVIGKKVILLDFWTYSCINCLRTTPYLNAWYEKYKDQGLEIIGVHSPEFDFEKNKENIQKALEQLNITYPIILDSNHGTWYAYHNQYWPRKYLIDIDGFIRYDHIGEGGYEETEQKIQELLKERSIVLNEPKEMPSTLVQTTGITTEASTPETYFGAERNENFGNGISHQKGEQQGVQPTAIKRDLFYLVGKWDIENEYASNIDSVNKLMMKYDAKEVYLVASADNPTDILVINDGHTVTADAGVDVQEGKIKVSTPRLYKIIKNEKAGEHLLELVVQQPGVHLFTFTFG